MHAHPKLCILLIALLFSSPYAQAGEPRKAQLKSLILPQVKLQNADLSGALQILKQAAEKQSGGTIKVSFALDLPKDYKPLCELSLELHAIPFPDALRCLGELAGVDFFAEGGTIHVRQKSAVLPSKPVAPDKPPVAVVAPPQKGLTGTLGKPPERVSETGGLHRAMDGSVQPEQSGYVAHRSLNGWSTAIDPKAGHDPNCVHIDTCPASCGCVFQCICKHPPAK